MAHSTHAALRLDMPLNTVLLLYTLFNYTCVPMSNTVDLMHLEEQTICLMTSFNACYHNSQNALQITVKRSLSSFQTKTFLTHHSLENLEIRA